MHDEDDCPFVRFDEISETVADGADVAVERRMGRCGAGGRKGEADGGVVVCVEDRGEGGVDGWMVPGAGDEDDGWFGGHCVWGSR